MALVDYYAIEEELQEDERLVRDNVRRFVEAKVMPVIGRHYQDGTFPEDLIPQFADLGLLGANLEGYGCAGMGDVAYGLAMQELERGDSAASARSARCRARSACIRSTPSAPRSRRSAASRAWPRGRSSAASG